MAAKPRQSGVLRPFPGHSPSSCGYFLASLHSASSPLGASGLRSVSLSFSVICVFLSAPAFGICDSTRDSTHGWSHGLFEPKADLSLTCPPDLSLTGPRMGHLTGPLDKPLDKPFAHFLISRRSSLRSSCCRDVLSHPFLSPQK